MNSSASRHTSRKQTQDELKRQIALLQARLEPESEPEASPVKVKSPKRKVLEPVTLAPATPSPKKKRKVDHRPSLGQPLPRPVFPTASTSNTSRARAGSSKPPTEQFKKLPPSNLIQKLANTTRRNDDDDALETTKRSTSFAAQPELPPPDYEEHASKRDDRLALIDSLEPGPYEHIPPLDDPNFEKLEPHSGIALVSRIVAHEDFSDHLRARYYLSPSRLYSAIRLLPDKQGYDVPVPGDWVTIAVVAERGPIKFTRAPVAIERESGDPDPKKQWKGKGRDNEPEKPSGKKYVNLKLIDFGARSGSKSSSTGGVSTIRGDAFLSLLLFESDGFDLMDRDDGRKPDKVYKGGSRGAFEHLTDVKEGDVIALLNPKILKPFQRSNDSPHPVNNILALTPESASSIMVLGRARDLGMCPVKKQDGKVCGSWCDKRLSDVCDYHVQHAVQRRRAARPEFSVGTSGMSTSSTHKNKSAYDPLRKWGLKPSDEGGGGSTYMVSGHIVTGSSSDPRTMHIAESIGREGQAKAKRILDGKESDRALKALLQRDKDGMKVVIKAREKARELVKGSTAEKAKASKKTTSAKTKKKVESNDDEDDVDQEDNVKKTAYSAEVIKSLGFDPSLKPGQKRFENKNVQHKLDALEAVRVARKEIILGPKPGPRIRSGVIAPKRDTKSVKAGDDSERMCDLDSSSDDELPEGLMSKTATVERNREDEKMIDLDDF